MPLRAVIVLLVLSVLSTGCIRQGADERAERMAAELREAKRTDGALERAHLFVERRAPAGESTVQPSRWFAAEQSMRSMRRHYPSRIAGSRAGALAAAPTWEWLGPANATGRTRTLEFHPQNPDILFAGGVSGGVWKSNDAGQSWEPISDDAVNLNIGALAIDPQRPDILYAGTGELYRNSAMPWSPMAGSGILKSIDGGRHWAPLLATQNDDFRYVSDIVFSPHDTQRFYAATNSGIWRTRDGGATFERLLRPADDQDRLRYEGCTDLAIRTDKPGDWLLGTCASRSVADRYWLPGSVTPPACGDPCPAAVFLNRNAGNDGQWETVLTEAGQGRTQMDIHRANQDVIYAVAASILPGHDRNGDGQGDYNNGLHALWRSTDGGVTWQVRLRNDSPDLLSASLFHFHFAVRPSLCNDNSSPDFYGAGWYNNAIAADPVNAEVVWVGGMTLFRSDDGGQHFGLASYYFEPNSTYVHPDQHRIRFHPGYDGVANQRVYSTNDGGVAVSDNAMAPVSTGNAALCTPRTGARVAWRNLSRGMGTTQFYAGAVFPDGSAYLGGTQDNGTWLGADASGPYAWRHIYPGDGGFAAVDPTNPSILYATYQYVSIGRSMDGGSTFVSAVNGLQDSTLFIMPYLIDPNAANRLYAGGLRVWRTDNRGGNWFAASAPLGGTSFNHRISAITVAPGNPQRMLAGNRTGIFRSGSALSSTSATTWASATPREGWVSRLAFDPNDSNVAYATYSTFGGVHVWKSVDAGANWQPLDGTGSGALPDVPVHAIAINPLDTRQLYLGTDLGLFVSLDGGAHWAVENTGYANVITEDLSIVQPPGRPPQLFAFTYGRGVWRTTLGDFDGVGDYRIDERISGMWWNAQQDGHGLMIEPLAIDGVAHVLASWFAYRAGQPVWLVGVGRAEGGRATLAMNAVTGARFPPDFRATDVRQEAWGTLDLEFASDSQAQLRWTPALPGYTAGEMPITPLLRTALPASDPAGAQVRACHSGNWYNASQNGHGFFVDIFELNGQRMLAVAWYVFHEGNPLFLVGSGPISGNSATVQLASTRGPDFPPNYRSSDLIRQAWGTARFTFTGTDQAQVTWSPTVTGFSSGSLPLTRLTRQLGRQCPP
ncbi:WD40/YVTN/BNR-like repeat-containing protein [Tahibacter amnicola]|uniref:Sortilin (Neurotensin receptor 3) n=1 Tax=Tahibacter amnicola TaxID=2976241 RepID=A0ABY6BHL8_9GAMM|nr:hypothetical protein [Tahibacter amnicola]UXI68833.1 hypothetical protein N4264_04030 [Tahibacter amnicola]